MNNSIKNFKTLKDIETDKLKEQKVLLNKIIDSLEYRIDSQDRLIADLERELAFVKQFRGYSL